MADTSTPAPAPGAPRRPSRVLAVEEIRRHWDLGEWREWQRTPHGRTNVSHFVTTDRGRFVVRVSNGRKTEESMAWEFALLEHLVGRGYPAPRIVPTGEGRPWAWVGGSLCSVTERIPGDFPDTGNPVHRHEMMRALAWFHREARDLPEGARPPARSRVPILPAGAGLLAEVEMLVAELVSAPDLVRFRRSREALEPAFRASAALAGGAVLPDMITHGSFGYTAVLFEGDRLTGVLDFERAAQELRALDLAYTLRALARSPGARGVPESGATEGSWDTIRLSELVAAYGALEPLTTAEVDRFPMVLRAQRLIKVANKAANLLAKHAAVTQGEKDGLKFIEMLELEAARVGWIEAHEMELTAAVAAGAR